ncbi:hypothetical protein TNCT_61641, partial [Trichonephila clavata]
MEDALGPGFPWEQVDGDRGMIDRSRRGHPYSDARGEILGPSEDDHCE